MVAFACSDAVVTTMPSSCRSRPVSGDAHYRVIAMCPKYLYSHLQDVGALASELDDTFNNAIVSIRGVQEGGRKLAQVNFEMICRKHEATSMFVTAR
jgi:hypothetical protein